MKERDSAERMLTSCSSEVLARLFPLPEIEMEQPDQSQTRLARFEHGAGREVQHGEGRHSCCEAAGPAESAQVSGEVETPRELVLPEVDAGRGPRGAAQRQGDRGREEHR